MSFINKSTNQAPPISMHKWWDRGLSSSPRNLSDRRCSDVSSNKTFKSRSSSWGQGLSKHTMFYIYLKILSDRGCPRMLYKELFKFFKSYKVTLYVLRQCKNKFSAAFFRWIFPQRLFKSLRIAIWNNYVRFHVI